MRRHASSTRYIISLIIEKFWKTQQRLQRELAELPRRNRVLQKITYETNELDCFFKESEAQRNHHTKCKSEAETFLGTVCGISVKPAEDYSKKLIWSCNDLHKHCWKGRGRLQASHHIKLVTKIRTSSKMAETWELIPVRQLPWKTE